MAGDEDDIWEDYSSEFMFPSEDEPCTCADQGHDATQHGYSGCEVEGCTCQAYWQHT